MHCGNCGHPNDDESLFCGACGTKREDPSPFQVGGTFAAGRYRADALLGEGGMGTVWRAHDTMLGRTVALKCLSTELTAHPTARRRMEQEARVLARVESPHVVQVRNVFEESGVLVLELEYVSGGDLDSVVKPGGMDERAVLTVITKTLAGLQAIHEAGLIHRDIKPGNVLLDARGEPKITDLGIAHDPQALEKTHLGARLGTPDYMSPEQIRGGTVDARSDIYSMGIMCYQLLTGLLPFSGTSEFDIVSAHIREAPDLGKLARSASPQTVAWVARALAKEPSDRWDDANSMAMAAQAIIEGAEVADPVASAAPNPMAPHPPAPTAQSQPPTALPNKAAAVPASANPSVVKEPPSAEVDAAPAPATTVSSGKSGSGMILAAAAVALLAVIGIVVIVTGANDADETAPTVSAATGTEAPASAEVAAPPKPVRRQPKAPPSLIPTLRSGDRWRFRYQRLPQNSADQWRLRDHFVDRTVLSVVRVPDGIAVKIKEVGGPSDNAVRVFTEIYNSEGFGRQTKEGVVISANWSTQQDKRAGGDVVPSNGRSVRLQGPDGSFWLHETLGKVGERTVSDRKKDTYLLTLIGYSVGGEKGGIIDGTPQRCVWNGRTKWLAPGEKQALHLAGLGHNYVSAKATRGSPFSIGDDAVEMASNLLMTGARVRPVKIGGGLGSLLVAKTWISPSHGEWLAALWYSKLQTTLTVSHMEGNTVSSYNVKLETVVQDQRKLKRNHSLLILQRGHACVVGIKGIGPRGRKFTMIRVPDSGRPSILGGDWPVKQ